MKKIIAISFALFLSATSLMAAKGPEDSRGENKDKTLPPSFSTLALNSSSYTNAIGVRAIGTSGITIKHFTKNSRAVEGILGFWPNAFSATLLIEQYANAFDEAGLNWYYGLGGHLSAKSDWVDGEPLGNRRVDGNVGLGVDGIFGIEYKIREVPIAVSLDVKPFLEVTTNGSAFVALDPGLGVKVTF